MALKNVVNNNHRNHNYMRIEEEIILLRKCVFDFITDTIIKDVKNSNVLEVGPAREPQGHNADYFIDTKAVLSQTNTYTSCDIVNLPGIDFVAKIEDLDKIVGYDKFDTIIALEVLEHVEGLWKVPEVLYNVLKPGGKIFISTPYHFLWHDPKPDFWRISENGLESLFGTLFDIDITKSCFDGTCHRPLHITMVGTSLKER